MQDLETRYARAADGTYIAYQTAGTGPIDVVWQPDWPGNIDMEWEFPVLQSFLGGIASFARLIRHDHRGVGLSSRNVPIPNLETRVSDLLAVLDAADVPSPVLVGTGASGSVHALLAATRPERGAALVWFDGAPRYAWAQDNPWGRKPEEMEAELVELETWGTEEYGRSFVAFEASIGNVLPDSDIDAFSKASRNACTPDVAIELTRMWADTDVRDVLPAIQIPTLIVCMSSLGEVDRGKDIAARIPQAEFVEIPGEGWTRATAERYVEELRQFVGASRPPVDVDSLLSTVLFTDIVGSTERQAALGDRGWSDLVDGHHDRVRRALERWHGVEQDTAGDGFYATFEGPARAIRCAHEIVESVRELGIEIRAGLHTGECRIIDGKIGGIAVSIGARVAATAAPSEVRVSQTVKDLVAGSGLRFEDAGEHELKGVPGRWRLFIVPDQGIGTQV
jgi:class 3 adenylate cyclase/pimeloyl-ACP methyl ester carboxylesterase